MPSWFICLKMINHSFAALSAQHLSSSVLTTKLSKLKLLKSKGGGGDKRNEPQSLLSQHLMCMWGAWVEGRKELIFEKLHQALMLYFETNGLSGFVGNWNWECESFLTDPTKCFSHLLIHVYLISSELLSYYHCLAKSGVATKTHSILLEHLLALFS